MSKSLVSFLISVVGATMHGVILSKSLNSSEL